MGIRFSQMVQPSAQQIAKILADPDLLSVDEVRAKAPTARFLRVVVPIGGGTR